MTHTILGLITIFGFLIVIFYAYKARKKSFEAFMRNRRNNNFKLLSEINKIDYILDIKNYIAPSFYAAFTAHYWQNNQIVFENESLLHTFLNQYNTLFWGKNTGFDFILAENIDTCNYMKTEKQYNGMTFVGNSENAIPQGYTFLNVFIYQYKVQK